MSTTTTHIETDRQFVPELRFKEFKYLWKTSKLGELGSVINGLTYSPNDINNNGTLVLRSSNVQNGALYLDDNVFVTVIEGKYNPVLVDDILICVRNGSKRLIGKNTLITEEVKGVAFGAFMAVYRSDFNRFLYYFFSSQGYYKEIHKNLGATINSINGSDLRKFKVNLPTLPEQQKIASFLSAVDEKIQQLTAKKNLLEQYKKGVMQKLFSGKLRFKDENGNDFPDWEKNTFGGVARFINGKAYKQAELLDKGKYRVLRVGNLFTNNEWYHSDLKLEEDKYIDKGDLIYAWSASFGPRFWEEEKVIYHYHIWKVVPNEDVDKLYLFHAFMSDVESIKSQSQGGTMFHITKGNIEARKFNFPCFKEQQKIATYLSSIDTKIETVNKRITQTQTFKKGLLQQMFV